MEIKEISPSNVEARELFRLLDEHNLAHCPPDTCHLTRPEELEDSKAVLLGVFLDGALVGMGGLKLKTEYAEITRMFLKPEVRGNGFAVKLLNELEAIAESEGYEYLMLETSEKFKPAFRLYLRYGFQLCEPFGEYVGKAYNKYMRKKIASNRAPNMGL